MSLIGKIENVNKCVTNQQNLEQYHISTFDINTCDSSCIVQTDNGKIALSKWVSPKRTRSEPFARVYKTLGELKSVTVIPVIKDEGLNGDCDHFNPITLAWMNLLNIYVILVPYVNAKKHNKKEDKITAQMFDNDEIKQKIEEIILFRSDAHHYNNNNFYKNFKDIYNQAVEKYKYIGKSLSINMHSLNKLEYEFKDYLEIKNKQSLKAALREKETNHLKEYTIYPKEIIQIKNFYEGEYFLTVDEIYFENNYLILREAKNSTSNFPSLGEIMDAFFKCLLFLNIDELKNEQDRVIPFKVKILLTGKNVVKNNSFDKEMSKEEIEKKLKESLNFSHHKIANLAALFYNYVQTGCTIIVGENR